MSDEKDKAAVSLGKKRMASMTAEQRKEFAMKGVKAREKIPKRKRKAHAQHALDVRWAEVRKAKVKATKKAKES